ncbi:hypothetical protein [Emticicia sp. 17c]|uniref:hypothetical protein n=1 Tax=Emticicia sp. 17c TaxID=3127704 RepID=UPI00301C5950
MKGANQRQTPAEGVPDGTRPMAAEPLAFSSVKHRSGGLLQKTALYKVQPAAFILE